jgi:hypothetical protein
VRRRNPIITVSTHCLQKPAYKHQGQRQVGIGLTPPGSPPIT